MRNIINVLFTIIITVTASVACTSDPLKVDAYSETISEISTNVLGTLSGSKASNSAIFKSQWNVNDYIRVYNNGNSYFFSADNQGESSKFSMMGNGSLSGQVYAFYPKSVSLTDGKGEFSLDSQTGLLEDIDRHYLMTSSAIISGNSANFVFESYTAVLAISTEFLYDNTSVTKVVLSGEGISNTVEITTGSNVNVNLLGNSDITLINPTIKDGYLFIAVIPTSGDFNIDVYDNIGGHFFTTTNCGSLNKGYINEPELNWDGGLEITFNPSTSDWDE